MEYSALGIVCARIRSVSAVGHYHHGRKAFILPRSNNSSTWFALLRLGLPYFGQSFWNFSKYWLSVLAIIVTPIFYIKKLLVFLPTSIIGLLNTIIGFYIFLDPIIFLQLATVAMTMYFFNILMNTNAQSFHGLTTFSASSGIWFLVLSVNNSAQDQQSSWLTVVGIMIGLSLIFLLIWKKLNQLGETKKYLWNYLKN